MPRKTLREKIEEKEPSDSTKHKILTAAVELFFEQGYEETTTRQIIQKAGVLNGSLYYFFKGKENILESIVIEQIEESLKYADDALKSTDNPMTVLLFPLGIELYTAEHSRKAADLLFHAQSSREIANAMTRIIHDWVFDHYPQYKDQVTSTEFKLNFMALISLMRSFVGQYADGSADFHYDDCMKLLIKMTSVFFQIPVFNIDALVKEICNKIENEKIIVGNGYLKVEIHEIDDSKKVDQLNLSSEAK